MTFTVIWKPVAESQLAAIWLETSNRSSITYAANAIEHELRRSPQSFGESRSEGRRVAVIRPLAVCFKVEEMDQIVRVISVRKVGKEI